MSTPSRKKCGHLRKRASRPRRVQGKPRRRRQDQRSSTPHGKDSIDKTTRTVIDTVGEADDKRLISLDQWSGCKKDTLHWTRTDGIHPSCNHPSEATTQIASDCKAKNYIQRSAAAQRERRPQASLKRRPSLPSPALEVFTKNLRIPHFFSSVCGHAETGGACWTILELKHYTRCTGDQRAIDVSPVLQGPGTPPLQS